jgi:hypothetical protein|tara:strand:+ start:2240 stop:2632 length:393 start_codon:yes stop_codon:yes gene_type:complete
MKDQLFKNKPDMNLVTDTIKLFGLSDFNDSTLFTKQNMIDLNTVQKINEIIPRLQDFYLPCKSKKYLTRLDEKRCITILRQLLKQYNYNLLTKEKCIKGEKFNYYQIIQYSNKKINTKQQEERKIVLSFD